MASTEDIVKRFMAELALPATREGLPDNAASDTEASPMPRYSRLSSSSSSLPPPPGVEPLHGTAASYYTRAVPEPRSLWVTPSMPAAAVTAHKNGDDTDEDQDDPNNDNGYSTYWKGPASTANAARAPANGSTLFASAFDVPELMSEDEFARAMEQYEKKDKNNKDKDTSAKSDGIPRILPSQLAALPDPDDIHGREDDAADGGGGLEGDTAFRNPFRRGFWRRVKDTFNATATFVPLADYGGSLSIPLRDALNDDAVSEQDLANRMGSTPLHIPRTLKLLIDKTARTLRLTTMPHQMESGGDVVMLHFPASNQLPVPVRDFFAIGGDKHVDPARVTIDFDDPGSGELATFTFRPQKHTEALIGGGRAWVGETSNHKHAIILRFSAPMSLEATLQDVFLVYKKRSKTEDLYHSHAPSTEEKALGDMLVTLAKAHQVFAPDSVPLAKGSNAVYTASMALGSALMHHKLAESTAASATTSATPAPSVVRASEDQRRTLEGYAKQVEAMVEVMKDETTRPSVARRRGEVLHQYLQAQATANKITKHALNTVLRHTQSLFRTHYTQSPYKSCLLKCEQFATSSKTSKLTVDKDFHNYFE